MHDFSELAQSELGNLFSALNRQPSLAIANWDTFQDICHRTWAKDIHPSEIAEFAKSIGLIYPRVFPPYVWIGGIGRERGGCALRVQKMLEDNQAPYVRDAGCWGVVVTWEGQKLMTMKDSLQGGFAAGSSFFAVFTPERCPPPSHNPVECFPCTRLQWRKDNGVTLRVFEEPSSDEDMIPF